MGTKSFWLSKEIDEKDIAKVLKKKGRSMSGLLNNFLKKECKILNGKKNE